MVLKKWKVSILVCQLDLKLVLFHLKPLMFQYRIKWINSTRWEPEFRCARIMFQYV